MAVYVDDAFIPFGRMKMSHMVADDPEELRKMAREIGLDIRWIQHAGSTHEHFDVSINMRDKAILNGARPVSRRFVGKLIRNKSAVARGEEPIYDLNEEIES